MSKPLDIDAVARRYLDLWQDQLAAMAADRDIAELTAKTIEVMNSGITAMASVAQATAHPRGPGDDGAAPSNPPKDHDSTADPSRAAAAAATSGDPDHDLAEFSRRLAELEQRVAQLETGTGGSGGRPRKKPSRPRS